MSSTEDKAYEIMRELDVDYVLVIFGGLVGYASDDINKFLWMVRIGGSTDKGKHIKEQDYYTSTGEFRIDKEGSPVLLNCLMYKMCYYRFGSVYTEQGKYDIFCSQLLFTLQLYTYMSFLMLYFNCDLFLFLNCYVEPNLTPLSFCIHFVLYVLMFSRNSYFSHW